MTLATFMGGFRVESAQSQCVDPLVAPRAILEIPGATFVAPDADCAAGFERWSIGGSDYCVAPCSDASAEQVLYDVGFQVDLAESGETALVNNFEFSTKPVLIVSVSGEILDTVLPGEETVVFLGAIASRPSTWGSLKRLYR